MPDDPLLRQLAANQFYAGMSDPRLEGANVLRAVLGLAGMEPTGSLPFDALRSSETVDVTAPEPTGRFPADMDRIFLGSRTELPSGTHVPTSSPPPVVADDAREVWERVMERYPHARSMVSRIQRKQMESGVLGEHANGTITLSPRAGESTLIHELAHAAADQQFTSPDARRKSYLSGGGTWGLDYRKRRGERVARAVEDSADARKSREYDERVTAKMRKQAEDYWAGKGPKPDWM